MADAQEKLLFPGCMIGNRIPYLEASARKVFEKLGVKTADAAFSCCPDPVGFQSVDKESWLALGARNLCLAEEAGKNIVSLCNGCTQTLTLVNHELKDSAHEKEKVNKILGKVGKEFKGSIDVSHFLTLLWKEVGIEKIKGAITNPLKDLKVACHTGCHYMRPSEILQTDDPMAPKGLREVVAATGAQVVDYDEEVLCCGTGASNTDEEVGLLVLKQKLDSAIKAGADVFAVICPSCYQQMDNNQRNLSKQFDGDYKIPILYITELLALAMGYTYDDLLLKRHRVKPKFLKEDK